jgi:tRNA threonylcarbamoyladenosine biosynthesis protein TsaE
MTAAEFTVANEAALDRLAALLAARLPDGVVCLSGTLGAGKTRLVRGIAAACGVDPARVVSPTFVLCQTYHGSRTIHHFDAYRIADDDEFLSLGPEEQFESPSLTFVEWGERVIDCLPADCLRLELIVLPDETRRVRLNAPPACEAMVEDLMEHWG